MKKFVCSVCGYVYEGTEAPEKCPVCKAPKEKFNELKADMAKYPKLSVAVREGRIKWVVEPGEEVSKLIMVDETDPRYHSQAAFNTPQEAEHFTKGFGNEPTRENGVENFFNRAFKTLT